MAVVNHRTLDAQFKVVYCGTPLGGKTSNLLYVHESLDPGIRGDMTSMAMRGNRTLFFDFLPVQSSKVAGFDTRWQLYTVPGQRVYNANRQVVLQGVDGIIFVADSDPNRREANLEALAATREALAQQGRRLEDLPVVFQYNKRDLPNAMSLAQMNEDLNPVGKFPVFPGVATGGYNIFACLDALTQRVLRNWVTQIKSVPVGRQIDPSNGVELCA